MDDCWKILDNFHKDAATERDFKLNSEQQNAFNAVKDKRSIFITGRSGSGKSTIISKIILWANHEQKKIGNTSTTGASAILIGGQTIQSFLGIGCGTKSAKNMANDVFLRKNNIATRLKSLEILIIDEISMLDDILFDKISEFLSIIRMDELPFGGVQLILCGDFSQNCPVEGTYCFLSNSWKALDIRNIVLEKFMRHHDDVEFQGILESLRFGIVSKKILIQLEQLKQTRFEIGIEPTILYAKNVDVDGINQSCYDKLVQNGAIYKSFNTIYNGFSNSWARSYKVPERIDLCIGAQVMVTFNISIEDHLVNGTRGIIIGFSIYPIIKICGSDKQVMIEPVMIKCEENPTNSFRFMPLKLAWALTIAKSQGCTLDYCIIDLSSWTYGQAYTALSRARSMKHVKLIGNIKAEYFKASLDVIKFYSALSP
jgi:ATP-dependent DNA helicase PIF1